MACSSAAGVIPAHMEHGAEDDGLFDPGFSPKLFGQFDQVGAMDRPRGQPDVGDHLGDRPVDQQIAVGNIGQPVAAFRFVHVMGGDEKRQALGGQQLNLLPEIAPGLGIDPAVGSSSSSSRG